MTLPPRDSFWRILTLFVLISGLLGQNPGQVWSAETDQKSPVGAVGGAVHADPFTGMADLPPVIRPPAQLGFVSRGLVADSPEHYVGGKYCTTCATVQ